MSVFQISCPSRVLLLDTELAELQAIPPGGIEVPPTLWCSLEAGHDGRHAVAGQFSGGPEVPDPYTVWVLWPDTVEYGPSRELIVLSPCTSPLTTTAPWPRCSNRPCQDWQTELHDGCVNLNKGWVSTDTGPTAGHAAYAEPYGTPPIGCADDHPHHGLRHRRDPRPR